MTLWCGFCKCHLSFPCSLHPCCVDINRGVCKRSRSARSTRTARTTRSTKGASKVRRDLINAEIRNMRALLPIPREEQENLSYLHSMSAVCTYIRKSVLLQGVPGGQGPGSSPPYETFLSALHGFILVVGAQGKLVYVSENVAEYLGHSMVDLLQGDTVYDMMERSDVNAARAQLESDDASPERSFVCRMQTSKAFRLKHGPCCSVLVRGCFRPAPRSPSRVPLSAGPPPRREPVFVALCTPTVDRCRGDDAAHPAPGFSSVHEADLRFAGVSDSVWYCLGYTAEEMCGRSWYSALHPEDLQRAADAHQSLGQASVGCEVETVLRFQHRDLSWRWVYTRATSHGDSPRIRCANYSVSRSEALYLIKKIHRDSSGPSLATAAPCPPPAAETPLPPRPGPAEDFRGQWSSDGRGEEPTAGARRAEGVTGGPDGYRVAPVSSSSSSCSGPSPVTMGDSVLLFTPPYSPALSPGPPAHEEPDCDFLLDTRGYADPSPPSPETPPSYYPYLGGGPFTHPSPFRAASPQAFHLPDLHSPPRYGSAGCVAGARSVPDCLSSLPDVLGSPGGSLGTLDPEDFALFEAPHLALRGVGVSPGSGPLTPSRSPASLDSFPYDDREHAEISILAQQISSLASSFDLYGGPGGGAQGAARPAADVRLAPCAWPRVPPLPAAPAFKPAPVLDDSVIDSLLKELDAADPGEARAGAGTLADALSDPFAPSRAGGHQQNPGLHQLHHYVHHGLQQDGSLDEASY